MLKYSFALIAAMLILLVSANGHLDPDNEFPVHRHVVDTSTNNPALSDHHDEQIDAENGVNKWHHHATKREYLGKDKGVGEPHENVFVVARHGERLEVEERDDKLIISSLTVEERDDKRLIVFVLTANTDDVIFNQLSITVGGYKFSTLFGFFKLDTWDAGTTVTVKLVSGLDANGYRIQRKKYNGLRGNTDPRPRQVDGMNAIDAFDIDSFNVSLNYGNGSDSVTQDDFDGGGNRIGVAAGSPNMPKLERKIATTWASLKKSGM